MRDDAALRRAVAALRRQDYAGAMQVCRHLLEADRKNADALDVMSQIAFEIGQREESIEYLRKAVQIEPKNARLRTNLGRAYTRLGKYREAHVQYDKSLKLAPQEPVTISEKATAYERQNRYDRARRLLRPFVEKGSPPAVIAAVHLRVLIHDGELDQAIAIGSRLLEEATEETTALRVACFELARAYERSERVSDAIATAARANAMFRPAYDPAADAAAVDASIRTFTAERIQALPRPASPSELPVFVFGMPRSGTTLVERIIHAHPDAFGCGETGLAHVLATKLGERFGSDRSYPDCVLDLEPAHVEEQSAEYLAALARLGPKAARLADKSLDNDRYLGLINVLFPQARAIHCRRDPVDTCLSCYMEPLNPGAAPYATDLGQLGFHFRQHERLMQHWAGVVFMPFLEVRYEELIADQEAVTRRIIEFCGLEWDDACLRFHEIERQDRTLSFDQVRKPLYGTSVGRAERFGALLDPLRQALAGEPPANTKETPGV